MGLSNKALKILLHEGRRRPFAGSVLTLGRQKISFTREYLDATAREFGVELRATARTSLNYHPQMAARNFISDETLFTALGFDECRSSDCSDYESADIVFDLNNAQTPAELCDRFDVIIDGGTVEHVFHLPNALGNIFRMLRVGGRIIHISPSSNHVDHGFYMFSPTLFYDYYQANGYEVNSLQLFRYTTRPNVDPWEMVDYTPGCLRRISFGGLDDSLYGIACVATKTASATCHVIPQQGMFVRAWQGAAKPAAKAKADRPAWRQAFSARWKTTRHALKQNMRSWLTFRRPLRWMGLKVTHRY